MPGRYQTLTRTRCPACSTVFRVTSDQLRAKAGKVRCGYCQKVFNAFDELIGESPAAPPLPAVDSPREPVTGHDAGSDAVATPAQAPEETQEEVAAAPAEFAEEAEEAEEAIPAETDIRDEASPAGEGVPATEVDPQGSDEHASSDELAGVAEPLDASSDDKSENAQVATLAAAEAATTAIPLSEETAEDSTLAAREAGLVAARDLSETPAFDRWTAGTLSPGPGGFAAEDKRRLKWPFVMAALMLAAVLSAQVAYHFRTELVRFLPAAADVFEALDVPVPLSAQSDFVSIEASDLQSDNTRGLFILNASLRNRAPYAQAWPALELTLTDAGDAPVARRVMGAADYLPPGSDLTTFPANAEIPVRLWIDAKGLGASGYRLYVFYP